MMQGSLLRLKSGGPVMTAIEVEYLPGEKGPDGLVTPGAPTQVRCAYFNDQGVLVRDVQLPAPALELVTPAFAQAMGKTKK